MLRKLDNLQKTDGGLIIKDDGLSLPLAEVIMVGEQVTVTEPGDIVHYIESREPGRCMHDGVEHFITVASNIIAILD